MVKAGMAVYPDITLAALPVGASNTERIFSDFNVCVNALIIVVLPVPANPFINIISSCSSEEMKPDNPSINLLWQPVGSNGKFVFSKSFK